MMSQVSSILQLYRFYLPDLSDELKCVICHLILINPKQTVCGCRVCEKCIRVYLSDGPKPCPGKQCDCSDSLTMNNITEDIASNKEISNFRVKCPFSSCSFKDSLKNVTKHIEFCDFRSVDRGESTIKPLFNEQQIHESKSCETSVINCEHLPIENPFNHQSNCEINECHINDCELSEVVCEKCGVKVLCSERKTHKEKLCEMRIINCEYCDRKITHKHFKSAHLNYYCDDLCGSYQRICPNNCDIKRMVDLKYHKTVCKSKTLESPFHHLKYEIDEDYKNDCELSEVVCEKCGVKVLCSERKTHKEKLCEMRIINCEYCGQEMTQKYFKSVHLKFVNNDKLCNEYMRICPNKCSISRQVKLRKHLKVCSNKKFECPIHGLACDIGRMTKEEIINHIQNGQISQNSLLTTKIEDLKRTLSTLGNELGEKTILSTVVMNKLTSDSLLEPEEMVDELEEKSSPIPIPIVVNNSFIPRNGTLVWKFTDFEVKRIEAESGGKNSVTSHPFYTSKFGCKMCLRIYPAGDGVGKGTHLSVFFVIMKGEFDDILSWPFEHKVTMSILDQDSWINHYSKTVKPNLELGCYAKPIDECNIGSGLPKFIMLSQIINSSIYQVSDTICIKICVNTKGISIS